MGVVVVYYRKFFSYDNIQCVHQQCESIVWFMEIVECETLDIIIRICWLTTVLLWMMLVTWHHLPSFLFMALFSMYFVVGTIFYARQRSYSVYMLWQFRLSVRPSVCHTGGSVKNGW